MLAEKGKSTEERVDGSTKFVGSTQEEGLENSSHCILHGFIIHYVYLFVFVVNHVCPQTRSGRSTK